VLTVLPLNEKPSYHIITPLPDRRDAYPGDSYLPFIALRFLETNTSTIVDIQLQVADMQEITDNLSPSLRSSTQTPFIA
jgi:hypothetical protein